MVIGILLSIATIGILCWLLFTLAIYALPLFAGVVAGSWAYEMGAGWPGGILVGLITAGLTLGLVFAAPAALAGYHAVHGIVKHAVPSETWQMLFSAIGAVAVGVTAWVRIAAAAPAQSGERLAGA
jgi:hypothetical protein